MNSKPIFITFEGTEGSGKSTQIQILSEWLKEKKIDHFLTREPGGTTAGEALRDILLNKHISLLKKSELLLHTCARLEHVQNIIKPQLASKKIVICDRFLDSTIAYQGYGNGINIELITKLHNMMVGNFYPDLTFFLDINTEISKERISLRSNQNDRYENKSEEYHNRVINGYRDIAKKNTNRVILINGRQDINQIQNTIRNKISSLLSIQNKA